MSQPDSAGFPRPLFVGTDRARGRLRRRRRGYPGRAVLGVNNFFASVGRSNDRRTRFPPVRGSDAGCESTSAPRWCFNPRFPSTREATTWRLSLTPCAEGFYASPERGKRPRTPTQDRARDRFNPRFPCTREATLAPLRAIIQLKDVSIHASPIRGKRRARHRLHAD